MNVLGDIDELNTSHYDLCLKHASQVLKPIVDDTPKFRGDALSDSGRWIFVEATPGLKHTQNIVGLGC